MTSPEVFQEIKNVMDSINSEIGKKSIEEPDAEEILKSLNKEGGGIEVVEDEFKPIHEPVREVQNRVEDKYNNTYGLDGSTTKDLRFNNGLMLSIAIAATGIANSEELSEVSEKQTVSVMAYFDDNNIDIDPDSSKNIQIYFDQFPRLTKLTSEISQWLNNICRTNSEGKHFDLVSEKINSPLFIDGPIIPPGLLIWQAYDNIGQESGTPMEDWSPKIYEILQNYINGIENAVIRDYPVYGVQKSTKSTRIMDSIVEKDPNINERDLPWTNDGIMFTKALQDESEKTTISYTPWYIEHKFDIGDRQKRITPFKNSKKVDLDLGTYNDYKRMFFFAKPPTRSTVYRIGVPLIVTRNHDIDTIRDIALSEMIKQYKEPLPIVVADDKVRIPKKVRNQFRKLIDVQSNIDKNEQRGYK